MLIAQLKNGTVAQVADYRSMFPGTSFPDSGPNAEFLAEHDCLQVAVSKPYDSETEKLVVVAPYVEQDRVFTVAVQPLTAQDLQARTDAQAAVVRAQRDDLLAKCDWTQLTDAPVDKTAWAVYRQALRDLPEQSGFPWQVELPKDPNHADSAAVV